MSAPEVYALKTQGYIDGLLPRQSGMRDVIDLSAAASFHAAIRSVFAR